MSRTLKDIIDYSQAPLFQWERAIGEPISEGKILEDAFIYSKIKEVLIKENAQSITGIIADEGRLESYLAAAVPNAKKIRHLTLTGAFEVAARRNVEADKVEVVVNIDDIPPNSQDAVVLNMILGCVSTSTDYKNIGDLIQLAASFLKEDGQLIVIRPNPAGGEFTTYKCLTPANDLKGGQDYDFIVRGLEGLGVMKNLYTPDDFLQQFTEASGLSMDTVQPINDVTASSTSAPFLLTVCKKKKGLSRSKGSA